jgi:hypothetical protein
MGTDIHFYVEKRNEQGDWDLIGPIDYDEDDYGEDEEPRPYIDWRKDPFRVGRNYKLFAILADVRNNYGFAGVKMGERLNPITEPRGIPDDASDLYRQFSDNYGIDGHSHSCLTLRELLNYDWTQKVTQYGVMSFNEYRKWYFRSNYNKEAVPNEYAGSVWGADIVHITEEEMQAKVQEAIDANNDKELIERFKNLYTRASWQAPYFACVPDFLGTVIPKMIQLAGGIDGNAPDNVRCIFFFDS